MTFVLNSIRFVTVELERRTIKRYLWEKINVGQRHDSPEVVTHIKNQELVIGTPAANSRCRG